MEMTMPGLVPTASDVLRRSARRVKPGVTGMGRPVLKGDRRGQTGSGMKMADVVVKVPSRKRARTREADVGSGMEVVEVVSRGADVPRKRARTREGGDREKERGRDEEDRATKRTRKR
jgi:hypothetical protein